MDSAVLGCREDRAGTDLYYNSPALTSQHNLRTWEGFLRKLRAIQRANEQEKRPVLFRGQSDAGWSLETTLERRGRERMEVLEYFRLIGSRVRPQLESITGRTFDVPEFNDLNRLLGTYDEFSLNLTFGRFPAYSYLIYTRHHGFPSPLLDWTRSPYVAAFFAFASAKPGVKRRSIYVWQDSRLHVGGTNTIMLQRLGPFVTTHQRHVLQQCDYSICLDFTTDNSEWRFRAHDEAFVGDGGDGGDGEAEPRLWKFTLPSSERLKVLKFLDDVNVNAYSLFGSEESLMETLAVRELDLPSK